MKAQASVRVDVPAASIFVLRTKEFHKVCTGFLDENAWICARPTTDRDLERQRHEKGECSDKCATDNPP